MKKISSMKKILMITHSSNISGGGETDFQTLLEHFKGRYYIYSIAPEGPNIDTIKSLSDEIFVIPDRIFPFEGFNIKKYVAYYYYSIIKLFTLVPYIVTNKNNIDVAFINSSVCIVEIIVLSFLKVPYYLSIKEIIEPKIVRKLLYKLFYWTSENVIVISNILKDLYIEVNKGAHPVLIRSAIDEEYYLLEKKKMTGPEYKENKIFTIVNIGVINPTKNQKLLIDAISKLNLNVQFKILFIGKVVDEKYFNYLLRLIHNYNLKNIKFIFTKDLSKAKVLEEIFESDCVVITSKKEGMSLVLVESLFMEKPLIATKVGIIPEIIKDGYNGFMVNDDPKELASVIEKLIVDSNLRLYISSNTYKSYKEGFNMDYYKSKHEEVLFSMNK